MKGSELMGILGPSKKEAWQKFASEIGAEYIDSGLLKGVRVELRYKVWTIVLDAFAVTTDGSSTYTRIRTIYIGDRDFDFKITRRNIFTRIAKAFGKVYVQTDDNDFDEEFAIKSNFESSVKEIFQNSDLKDLFKYTKQVNFVVKKAKGKGDTRHITDEKELYFNTEGIIKDNEILTNLFGIFIFLLDAFEVNGIAKTKEPSVVLVK